jgi:phage-related protein
MANSELGKAYVQIIPSAKGIKGMIQKQLGAEVASAGDKLGESLGSKIKSLAIKAIAAAGIGKVISASIYQGGELEQSLGGVETLFKDSADKVKAYAKEAYKTTGVSANEYMQNVTSFAAALVSSLGGDTDKASKIANQAMIDMGDNANKMGTSMQDIQNAYQGFSKQNYTMLDNLKLGYGGTKKEMERLLADATKLTGVKYDIDNLGDVYQAIHVIQQELGITGTTAKEASETLQGSFSAMKASFVDVLGNLALGENIKPSLINLAETTETFLVGNLIPMLARVLKGIPVVIENGIKEFGPIMINAGKEIMNQFGLSIGNNTSITEAFSSLKNNISPAIESIRTTIMKIPEFFMSAGQSIAPIIDTIVVAIGRLKFDGIRELIDALLPAISSGFEKFIQIVKPAIDGVVESFVNLWNKAQPLLSLLSEALTPAFNVLGSFLGGVFKGALIAVEGLFDGLSVAIDFLSPLIEVLINAFKKLEPALNTVAEWIGTVIGLFGGMGSAGNGLSEMIKTAWSNIKSVISAAGNIIKSIIEGIKSVFSGLGVAGNALKTALSLVWNGIKGIISGASQGIKTIIENIKRFFTGLGDAGNRLKGLLSTAWGSISNLVKTSKDAIKITIDSIKGFFTGLSQKADSLFKAISSAWKSITKAIETAAGKVSTFIDGIKKVFDSLFHVDLFGAGSAIMDGFLNGLKSMWTSVTSFISGIAEWIAQHKGPISYDRKLLIPAGLAIMEGLDEGLRDSFKDVKDTIFDINSEIEDELGNVDPHPDFNIDDYDFNYPNDGSGFANNEPGNLGPVPANINLVIAGRAFKGFVEDITKLQDAEINLDLQY